MDLEQQLSGLQTELKAHFAKAAEQQKETGSMNAELKTKIDALQKQVDALDVKLAEKHAGTDVGETLEETLKKDEGVQRLLRDKSGSAVFQIKGRQFKQLFERKTTITETAVGSQTTGVLQIDRIPGITVEPRQALKVRNLLPARPTVMQVIDFVKVQVPMSVASPQTEANDKAENAVTFVAASERVQTLATWIPASKQVLDDMSELMGYLQTTLPYYVDLEEEIQLLSGSGAGTNLHGLITQATAFTTGLLIGTSWNKIDIIGRVIEQITIAKEIQPTFIVLNPTDWWDIRLTKDQFGRYILGDPQSSVAPNIFGLDVVYTTSVASGTFLVGSGSPIASEIRDRMEMQVEIATQHASFFTQNLIAIRAEKRLALIVKRLGSFVTGTFTTSP